MLPIRKLQTSRSLLKIPAEQFPKQAARHDESIPVIYEMESIRPGFLLQRKRRLQFRKNLFFAVKRRVPHVDFVPDLFPFHGGN
jgi:hypothetical protein